MTALFSVLFIKDKLTADTSRPVITVDSELSEVSVKVTDEELLKGVTAYDEKDEGDIYCYPVKLDDGTVIQRYTRSSFYSDTLRTQISCPVDIRVGYKNKLGKTRGTWEWYVGAEDIFLNLYTPEGSRQFDRRTGEMSDQKTSADFNIGIPMISTGCKFSF